MNSEADAEKNGTLASPATARASSVLPVPGAPASSTPRGMRAPSLRYLSGARPAAPELSKHPAATTPHTAGEEDEQCHQQDGRPEAEEDRGEQRALSRRRGA